MKLNLRIGLLFLLAFLLLTLVLNVPAVLEIDRQLTLAIYDVFKSPLLTNVLTLITDYAIVAAVGLFLVALFVHIRHTLTTAIIFLISSGITYAGSELLKQVLQRARPFDALNGVVYLGAMLPDKFSFPSSHSAMAFFVAYFISRVLKLSKLETFIAYALAVLVAISRIYLGAHYVTDTVAGMLLGMCIGELAFVAARVIWHKRKLNYR